jgi:pyruvate-formate lyase
MLKKMTKLNSYEMEIRFTEIYKKYIDKYPGLREVMCVKEMFSELLCDIREEDVFAGRDRYGVIGFTPEIGGSGGYGYYYAEEAIIAEISRNDIDDGYREKLQECLSFWENEATKAKVRKAYTENISSTLPSDNFTGEPGVAFPLYRMGGIYLNYDKLMKLGISGLLKEVGDTEKKNEDKELFHAMRMSLELIKDACINYAAQARNLEKNEMAAALERITEAPPNNLREAIQLMWIYTIFSRGLNYGRMDVYLGDFYSKDIDSGLVTEDEALQLIIGLWKLIAERKTTWNGRVIIGGMGRRNEQNADRFALAAMEASLQVKEIEPQLSLRFYKGMNPALMEKALEVIGEGRTYPMLYNDDVNVEAVQKAFGVTYEEALQYMPFGCGEYILDHRSFGTPSGVINLLKALEISLHNGKDPMTGRQMGLKTGEFENFESFEDFYEAYKKQVRYFVEALAKQEELEYKVTGENAAFLYLSMLYDGCMERGKAIFNGGIQYLGGTLETYGNVNTADSLTAIKKLVFEKKSIDKKQLLMALEANFEGYETERSMLLNAPKYGNDDEEADSMAVDHHNFVCNTIIEAGKRTSLHSYLTVIINNSTNTTFGGWTLASADGRKAKEPMANANMPSAGSDKKGITAVLNSMVKIDPSIHAGAVQNMKFSKDLFTKNKGVVKSLLDSYFKMGGTQAMITVINRGDLEKAMLEPEKYSHIFVRVGGFSARFVELEPAVQKEIISRTLY